MAYIPNEWKDQIVQRPKTYQVQNNVEDGSITLLDSFGNVTELGTPVNADYMNHIEDGVAGCAIRLYNATETFYLNEWVKDGDKLYKSLQDNNKGHATSEADWWGEVSLGGAGMQVGTIFPHTASADFVPENSLPCNGTEYAQAQFPTLWTYWLVAGRLNTCTYEEYQSAIDTYGECLKWALDTSTGKFKVPTKKNEYRILKEEAPVVPNDENIRLVGGGVGRGLYINNAKIGANLYEVGLEVLSGPLSVEAPVQFEHSGLKVDLSNAQQVEILRYFVVVATDAINQSEMDWSAWASSLNEKMNKDFSNAEYTQTFKDVVVGWGIPDWDSAITLTQSMTPYTCPSAGFLYLFAIPSNTDAYVYIYGENQSLPTVGKSLYRLTVYANGKMGGSTIYPVAKGQVLTQYSGGGTEWEAFFVPMKGGN